MNYLPARSNPAGKESKKLTRKGGNGMSQLNEVNLYENPESSYYPNASTDSNLDWSIVFVVVI